MHHPTKWNVLIPLIALAVLGGPTLAAEVPEPSAQALSPQDGHLKRFAGSRFSI
jgi:hypothetical protein